MTSAAYKRCAEDLSACGHVVVPQSYVTSLTLNRGSDKSKAFVNTHFLSIISEEEVKPSI